MLIVVRHGVVNSGLKVLGNGQLVQRWLCHQQWKNHFPNIPETANVPEDGATLHVQNAQNCAIYPILHFTSFRKGFLVIKTLMKQGSAGWSQILKGMAQPPQCHPVALEKSCKQCPKREPYCHRSHQFLSVGPRTPWTPGSEYVRIDV